MSRTDRFHPKDPAHGLYCKVPGCDVCHKGPWWKRVRNRRRRKALRELEAEQLGDNRGKFRGPDPHAAKGTW